MALARTTYFEMTHFMAHNPQSTHNFASNSANISSQLPNSPSRAISLDENKLFVSFFLPVLFASSDVDNLWKK